MRAVLAFACRAFPPDHRARRSDEVVDTALLASEGSAWRMAREALSLVVAGARQRLRAESGRSLRDGAALLAGVLALANLAIALAGIALAVRPLFRTVVRLSPTPSRAVRTASTGGGSPSPLQPRGWFSV
jgi:hypothetical protein